MRGSDLAAPPLSAVPPVMCGSGVDASRCMVSAEPRRREAVLNPGHVQAVVVKYRKVVLFTKTYCFNFVSLWTVCVEGGELLGQMALEALHAAFTVILFQALYWVAHVVSKHSFLSYKYTVLSPYGVVGASPRVPCSQACAG
jgi:hypothetical protein